MFIQRYYKSKCSAAELGEKGTAVAEAIAYGWCGVTSQVTPCLTNERIAEGLQLLTLLFKSSTKERLWRLKILRIKKQRRK